MTAAVYVESGCGERYRQHAGSTSAQAIREGRYHPLRANPARLAFLQWLQRYLNGHPAVTGELSHALQVALRPYRHPKLYRAIYPFKALAVRLKVF
jgi:hypothetical protein